LREGLPYTVIDQPGDLECISINIHTTTKNKIIITNIYHPPTCLLPLDQSALIYRRLFEPVKNLVVGDFNAYHTLFGSSTNNTRGQLLVDLADETNLTCLNTGEGTHITPAGGLTPLDLAFASTDIALNMQWSVLGDTLGSDHFPCMVIYGENAVYNNDRITRWLYDKADWNLFKTACQAEITDDLVDSQDLSGSYTRLTATILDIASRHIPSSKPSNGAPIRATLFWNELCDSAIKLRKKARTRMHMSKDLDDCIEYRRLKAIAQRNLKQAKTGAWETYCTTLNDKTKLGAVWSTARAMAGVNKSTTVPTLLVGTVHCLTNASKAEALASSYRTVADGSRYSPKFTLHKNKFEIEHKQYIHSQIQNDNKNDDLNSKFTIHELVEAVRLSKPNTSPGDDNISTNIIKQLPLTALHTILKLYNYLWEGGEGLPTPWKHSIVIPIYKPGKVKTDPSSYRPISLTSSLCKLMERIVTTRLSSFLEANNLLNECQAGFRNGRSCVDHILSLQDEVTKSLSRGGHTLAVFVDLEKAFDLMWADGLLFKLRRLGISRNIYMFIKHFLADRTIQVRVGNTLSGSVRLVNGCPQGSVLSPLLFILMMNDYPPDPRGGSSNCLFADDATIYKSGHILQHTTNNIQRYLHKIHEWCEEWGLLVSASKTICVLFTRRRIVPLPLTLGDTPLIYEKTAKFLGVIFDEKMNWGAHIKYTIEKCTKRLNLMKCMSGRIWGGGKRVQLTLYKALIQSLLDYGSQALLGAPATTLTKYDTIQHKALAICCGAIHSTSIQALQAETGVMPLSLRRERLSLRYAAKITQNNHHPTRKILIPTYHKAWAKNPLGNAIFHDHIAPTLSSFNLPPLQPILHHPTWKLAPCHIDTTLKNIIHRHTHSLTVQHALAMQFIDQFVDYVKIFTDGSRTPGGLVGSSVCAPLLNLERVERLADGATIYTAELHAIGMALMAVPGVAPAAKCFVIFSDSLGAVQSISKGGPLMGPLLSIRQRVDELTGKGIELIIAWVPSHIGIQGNERADFLAKRACLRPTIDYNIQINISNYIQAIDTHILNRWQAVWDVGPNGRHMHSVEPTVTQKLKYTSPGHKQLEHNITRLRLGRCLLNEYLHKIKQHDTGYCEGGCGVTETVHHYLLECPGNVTLHTALENACALSNAPFTLHYILNNRSCQQIIHTYLLATNKKI